MLPTIARCPEHPAFLKEIAKILLYFAGVVLFGALLAPPLYGGAGWLAANGVMRFLAQVDFHSYFDRAILVAAVVLLIPAACSLKIGSVSDLGLRPNPQWRRDLAAGLFLAALSSAILILCASACGAWRLRDPGRLRSVAAQIPAAIIVSLLEEALFRGGMQGLVRRTASKWTTLVFVAALFAAVHFLKPPQNSITGAIDWSSGFRVIPKTIWQFQDPGLVVGGLCTLFAVGLILGYVREKTRSLWMPIGLHSGWILGKSFGQIGWLKANRHAPSASPWFQDHLLSGVAPLLILAATGALAAFLLSRLPRSEPQP